MNFFSLGALLYANQQSRIPLLISLILTAATTAITIIFLANSQPVLPILYTLTRPEQTLVVKWWLLRIPMFSLLFSLIGHVVYLTLQSIDQFILQLFTWFSVFTQVVLLLALLRIIFITA